VLDGGLPSALREAAVVGGAVAGGALLWALKRRFL